MRSTGVWQRTEHGVRTRGADLGRSITARRFSLDPASGERRGLETSGRSESWGERDTGRGSNHSMNKDEKSTGESTRGRDECKRQRAGAVMRRVKRKRANNDNGKTIEKKMDIVLKIGKFAR